MTAALTGLLGSGLRTNSPRKARLATFSLGNKEPKTRSRIGTKKQGPSQVGSLSFHLVQKSPVTPWVAIEKPAEFPLGQGWACLSILRRTASRED